MYDIYATDMILEHCVPDKEKINTVIPYAVIHFVLSGEGYINGERVTENTVFISSENNRMYYYPSSNDPWSYVYIRLKGADVDKAFHDHGFNKGITVLPFEKQDALLNILSLHQSISNTANTDAGRIVANAVFLLFKKKSDRSTVKSKPIEHVEQISKFIDENYYKKITVDNIAAKFHLNKNYIRTVFVEHFRISPKQYIQKLRMERAAFLLTNTPEDIILIASSVGYDDPLLFSKMFKRYYGVSPKNYRSDHCK